MDPAHHLTTSPPHRFAIIVAGGSGTRMGTERPKQFLPLRGEPVLLHTLRRFAAAELQVKEIVLVLPAGQFELWQELCATHHVQLPHRLVAGGATRWASVKAGLAALKEETAGLVAVHDGVRPLVPGAVLEAAYRAAAEQRAVAVAVPSKDSVRLSSRGSSQALDRRHCWLVQTPQCFELDLLRQAYRLPELPTFTDDASVVEDLHPIHLVSGDYRNLKITTPEDLVIAEALLGM